MHLMLKVFLLTWTLSAGAVLAFEPVHGNFAAQTDCEALQSIRKGGNPGGVRLGKGNIYPAVGLNEPNGKYVQVKVAGAQPELRWVPVECGELSAGVPLGGSPSPLPRPADAGRYLLAASWQPAFCETKPDKAECRTQSPERIDATHFSLHGLWPQPEGNVFCGVSAAERQAAGKGRWERLPEPDIAAPTRVRLAAAMPGMASKLQRHEYTKHGRCFPGNADVYFRTSLHLLDQLNASALRALMAANLGKTLSAEEMRRAFDQSFGAGAGQALEIHCVGDIDTRRTLISEVRVSLKGPLDDTVRLPDVLDPVAPNHSDCDRGIVDPAGLN